MLIFLSYRWNIVFLSTAIFQTKKKRSFNTDNTNAKKRRNQSKTTSIAKEPTKPKDMTKRNDVSSLLGQSTMFSQCSTSTESGYDNINDMMLNETIASEMKDDSQFSKSKFSIQELVGMDEGLTQTQRVDDADEMSMSQGGHNTIVEIDDMEDSQFFGNETSLSSVKDDVRSKVDINVPCPRWGSTMTMIDESKIMVYGGQGIDPKTNDYVTFNDLFVYDVINRTWKQPVNCEGKHTTIIYDVEMK